MARHYAPQPPPKQVSFAETLTKHTQPRARAAHMVVAADEARQRGAPYTSGRTLPSGRGYVFERADPGRIHMGVSLRDQHQRLRGSFVATAVSILAVEAAFIAWPITATVLWGVQAAINWVWFLYAIRAMMLLWAILTSASLAVEKLWGTGTYHWSAFYRVYGSFAPSRALVAWASLAFGAGCILGGIATVVSAAVYTFYTSKVLYGLSLGIGALAVCESFVAPFVLYHFGVVAPVNRARDVEMRKMRSRQYANPYRASPPS